MGRQKVEERPTSFSSFAAYLEAVSDTPARLALRATATSSYQEEITKGICLSGAEMKRSLRWHDLVALGIGGMVGAGVFVTTGRACRQFAGPGAIISYAIAGLCALLSALCYTEFAVELPVAGGAFTYLRVTFGEFPAFLAGANLIVDYVMSNAAVARGFTSYLATAIGSPVTKWRLTIISLPAGFNEVDLLAFFIVVTITAVICYSTRESSVANKILTALHLVFIAFIIIVGFLNGHWRNLVEAGDRNHNPSGFFPFGISGVFNGAAMVYMSYIGFDAVSTMAEEVENPPKDIPIGVSGSVAIVTVLYCLMTTSMSVLLPYDKIDSEAPFSAAFGGSWISRVVGAGASFGILTSLMVAMLGQARYMCVIGRSGVVPSWFARVHTKTSTPLNASIATGMFTAALALFTDLDILLGLVSIGTLFVFYMVANALIYRRFAASGTTDPRRTLCFLSFFSVVSAAITVVWHLMQKGRLKTTLLCACAALAIGGGQIFRSTTSEVRKPTLWGVPVMPWVPCASIFLNIFLLGSLDTPSFVRFGVFSALCVLFYALYSVHASFDAHSVTLIEDCDT